MAPWMPVPPFSRLTPGQVVCYILPVMGGIIRKRTLRSRAGFAAAFLLALSSATLASDYPRRIAIAPFAVLGPQDEIRQTVDILPQLISSRLMALSGAEVLLLSPADKPAADAAKKAGLPLLLAGSVAKLGAGYSIDVSVTDLATGRVAGAFFAAAATEDEIIPRLGDLASDISEKVFGVKPAVRAIPAPREAQRQDIVAAGRPAKGIAGMEPAVPPAAAVPAPVPASPAAAAAPPDSKEEWVPSSLKKVAESGKIADELHGVVAGDMDSGGNGEIIAYGKKAIHLYRVSGAELQLKSKVTEGLPGQMLNVEAVDLDGDGAKELLVTGKDGDRIRSSVFKRSGETYAKAADRLPYYLVLLPDWRGKAVVAGQQVGDETPFHGKLYAMTWDGNTLRMGEALPADTLQVPLSSGILGLSSGKIGEEWKWIYTDENGRLRILDPRGTTEYKTGKKYGWSGDSFEWGLHLPRVGKTRYPVRKAARITHGPGWSPMVLLPEEEEGMMNLMESFSKTTRLVLLRWDGGEFVEAAGTPKGDRIYSGADFLSPDGLRREGKVVASTIEQPDGVLKGGVSRLVLFQVE